MAFRFRFRVQKKDRFLFYLADKVKNFLGSANSKRRNDNISSPLKGSFKDFCQLFYIIRFLCGMQSVAVRGLHYDIIRFKRMLWISY